MDDALRRSMLAYYDQRAAEYEEAYTRGTGTASITDPAVFTTEIIDLAQVVGRFGSGDFIDLACGTGYWVPYYAPRAASITLFDQSVGMLAHARAQTERLGIVAQCSFVREDFFDYLFPAAVFDSALVGFFVSHLAPSEEREFFARLQRMLKPSGRFLILDSAWTDLRAQYNLKDGRQERRLNDGTTFDIYKRYLDRDDFTRWKHELGAEVRVEYFGAALCAVSGRL
jgi:demethylmenaquinone methyltransferase/2-methoxy-6-polyprenyl-1,4-benzoquinol methylase